MPKALSAPKSSAVSSLSLGFGSLHYRPGPIQCNRKLGSDGCEKQYEITASSLYRALSHFMWKLPSNSGLCPWSLPQIPCRSACAHTPSWSWSWLWGERCPLPPLEAIRSRSWCPGPPCCSALTLLAEQQEEQCKQPHWSDRKWVMILFLRPSFQTGIDPRQNCSWHKPLYVFSRTEASWRSDCCLSEDTNREPCQIKSQGT